MRTRKMLCRVLCIVFLVSTYLTVGSTPIEAKETSVLFDFVNFDEDITDGSLTGPVVYDAAVFHDSGRSLKYQRTDPESYILIDKTFTASVGQKFSASCWVKTQNISDGGNALICIQAYDVNGDWLDGAYLGEGVQGTSDWTLLTVPAYQMPANTAKACVTIYISRGATGTAWLDDLSIYQEKAKLLDTCLISPSYRGITADNKTGDIKIEATVLDSPEFDLTTMKVVFEMIDSSGTTIASSEAADVQAPVTGVFDSSALTEGSYTLRTTVMDKATSSVLDKEEWPITKISTSELPSSYVDSHGRFIKDGAPFFPLGFFFSELAQEDVSGTPFETLWGYSKEVAAEVKAYVPMIMSADTAPAVTVTGGGDWLNWTVRNYNNKTYIFSVNNTTSGRSTVSYTIPGARSCRDLTAGNQSLPVTNGRFSTSSYSSLGVKIFEISY